MVKPILFCCTFLVLTACGGGDSDNDDSAAPSSRPSSQSSSLMSSASVSPVASSASSSSTAEFGAPANVSATPGSASISLDWDTVTNATGYHIYYASEANIIPANINSFEGGTQIQNVTPPHVISGLQNGTTYYAVVTAVNGNTESEASSEVSATPGVVDLAKQPTAQEVLIVEMINRARANPSAEASRYGIGLNDGISGTPISTAPKPPLAHNLFLIDSARAHSQWMLEEDVFDHTGVDGSSPGDRMEDAGYVFTGSWTWGENIAQGGTSGSTINLTDYAYSHHEGLFKSPGHRKNILSTGFREIGVGQKQGYYFADGTNWLSSMLTENFARSGSHYFLTGVVYNDTNNNDFYDVGEGLEGITISIDGEGHAVFATGAYSIPLINGTYELNISGDALGNSVMHTVEIDDANVKVDVIKNSEAVEVVSW